MIVISTIGLVIAIATLISVFVALMCMTILGGRILLRAEDWNRELAKRLDTGTKKPFVQPFAESYLRRTRRLSATIVISIRIVAALMAMITALLLWFTVAGMVG